MSKHTITLPDPSKIPLHSSNIFVWMTYFLSPYKWVVIGFFTYRTIRYTLMSLFPILFGIVIDAVKDGHVSLEQPFYLYLLAAYMLLHAVLLINTVFAPEARVIEKAARALTLFSINHLNSLSLNWHEKQGSGGKLQRVMTGRKGFQEFMCHVRWDVFPLIGGIIATIVTFFITNMPAFYLLIFLGFIVSFTWASWFFARGYFEKYNVFNDKFEKLLSGVYEFVGAIRTSKAFHLKDYVHQKAERLEEVGQEAIMSAYRLNLFRWTMCNLIATAWLSVFAVGGLLWVLDGTISIGVYAGTFVLATHLWGHCETLASILEKFYEYGNGMHRLFETLRVQPKNLDLQPSHPVPNDWSTISLSNISYLYDGESGHGVRDISFTVKRGQKIAFVGNSGAGKSTLVKLLMKQMLPDSGVFQLGDSNVAHIPTADWLAQIGFVPQDVELFNLSVRENIVIDRDDIDDALLGQVLKQSALDDFTNGLPAGLDTVIGERGIKLSGGQRQRLGIARALIRQAPIMIFDEATSSLDSISEAKIQQAIENSFEGRTVFVIAHRLSTIRNVDRIIVLDQGRIIEDGPFDTLIAQKGHFATLWDIQSKIIPDSP